MMFLDCPAYLHGTALNGAAFRHFGHGRKYTAGPDQGM